MAEIYPQRYCHQVNFREKTVKTGAEVAAILTLRKDIFTCRINSIGYKQFK